MKISSFASSEFEALFYMTWSASFWANKAINKGNKLALIDDQFPIDDKTFAVETKI